MKPRISRRAEQVIASPMRKFAPLIRQAEADGAEIIKLHIGDPDLAVPPELLKAIKEYKGKTLPYAPSSGIPSHVEAWVKYYAGFGVVLKPENVIPTTGGAEAIQMALMAVADPDDEIIVFEPLYSGFKAGAGMYNIRLVPVPLRLENGFALPDREVIMSKITSRTKAIVVINPDNPTGKLWSKKELEQIIAIAIEKNLFIISDETYREICFTGKPSCMLAFSKAKDRIVLVDSLSKRFSAPGARIGCIASYNEELMGAALKFAMARLSSPTLEQLGFIPLLRNPKKFTKNIVAEYRRRRDAVTAELKKIHGVTFHEPGGAFYLVAALPVDSSEKFVTFMLKTFRSGGKTVMITPIADFYMTKGAGRNEIRIALVRTPAVLRASVRLIALGLKAYKA